MSSKELTKLRKEIDAVDSSILKLINIRMCLATHTVKYKKEVKATGREKQIYTRLAKETKKLPYLNAKFTKELLDLMMAHSKKLQYKESSKK
jgi:chorismate mutase